MSPSPDAIPPTSSQPSERAAQIFPVRTVQWGNRVWLLLVIVCGALFLDGLDTSMMGVALPDIGHTLGLESSTLQWLVSGYVLGFGGFLLLGGRVSDLLSRRTVFLLAVATYGVASIVSAGMSDVLPLIALRFIKGAAAGFTVPAGLAILTTNFVEGPARNRAFGIYTLGVASGYSLGLVFGGLLTEIGWRVTLLFPGPVALVLVILGLRGIPRTASTRRASLRHFDFLGSLTITIALLGVVYAIAGAPDRGWSAPGTVVPLIIGAAALAAFVVVELRHQHPLLRLGLLRNVTLVHANLAGFALFGSFASFQFLSTIYLQSSLGWSPLQTALGLLPIGVVVVIAAPRLVPVTVRLGTPVSILLGLLVCAGAYALFLRAEPGMLYIEFLFPTTVLSGIGFSLAFAAINAQATAGVSDSDQGLAGGLINTSLQVGTVTVLAVVSGLFSTPTAGRSQVALPGQTSAVSAIIAALIAAVILTVALIVVQAIARRQRVTPSPDPEEPA